MVNYEVGRLFLVKITLRSKMKQGVIKFAEHDGVFVIKMEGDVRLTLCLSFDEFINNMFASPGFCAVIFDLTDALAIDSTTLGLMAKIAICGEPLLKEKPLVITNTAGITRILVTMGFQDIFRLAEKSAVDSGEFQTLNTKTGCEKTVQNKVIEAHRTLMSLNDENKNTFQELVDSLGQR